MFLSCRQSQALARAVARAAATSKELVTSHVTSTPATAATTRSLEIAAAALCGYVLALLLLACVNRRVRIHACASEESEAALLIGPQKHMLDKNSQCSAHTELMDGDASATKVRMNSMRHEGPNRVGHVGPKSLHTAPRDISVGTTKLQSSSIGPEASMCSSRTYSRARLESNCASPTASPSRSESDTPGLSRDATSHAQRCVNHL